MYPFKNLKFKNIYFIIINDQKYFNWKSIFLQTIRNYLGLEKSCYFTQKVTACNIRCGHENKTMSQQEYLLIIYHSLIMSLHYKLVFWKRKLD